jgi:outer membrane protein TolC
LNLASAYYGILRFQRVVEARQRNVDALTENERVVSRLVDVGRVPKVELLRIQTRLANIRQQLIEAQNMLDVAYYVLNALMGINDISFRVVPTDKLEFTPRPVDLPSLVQEALARRPFVLERERQVRLAEAQLGLARSQLRPVVGIQGLWYAGGTSLSHGLTQGIVSPVGTRQQNEWGAQVFVSVPIFDRPLREQQRQAAFALSRARQELAGARLSVQREVATAYADLKSAEARVAAAQTALASCDCAEFVRKVGMGWCGLVWVVTH